jgi:hypothetical protein
MAGWEGSGPRWEVSRRDDGPVEEQQLERPAPRSARGN